MDGWADDDNLDIDIQDDLNEAVESKVDAITQPVEKGLTNEVQASNVNIGGIGAASGTAPEDIAIQPEADGWADDDNLDIEIDDNLIAGAGENEQVIGQDERTAPPNSSMQVAVTDGNVARQPVQGGWEDNDELDIDNIDATEMKTIELKQPGEKSAAKVLEGNQSSKSSHMSQHSDTVVEGQGLEEPMDIQWNQMSKPEKEQFSFNIPGIAVQAAAEPVVKNEVQNDWGDADQLDDIDLEELEQDAFEAQNQMAEQPKNDEQGIQPAVTA